MGRDWADIADMIDAGAERIAPKLAAIRLVMETSRLPEGTAIYASAGSNQLALYPESGLDGDFRKTAAAYGFEVLDEELGQPQFLTGEWIKVAVSETVRRAGELLNYLPGEYANGIPNAPSPLAAAITSALVGGGVGYLGGRAIESILPFDARRKLRRTGAVVGGGLAASPALAWAALNLRDQGLPGLLDSRPLDERPELLPDLAAPKQGFAFGDAFDTMRKEASAEMFERAGFGRPRNACSVDVDAIGRTLWLAGTPTPVLAGTLGVLHAAQRMPDPEAEPGVATGHQLGQLALNAGRGYIAGALAGGLLNKVTGFPVGAHRAGIIGAALTVLPVFLGTSS